MVHWPHGVEVLSSLVIFEQGCCIWRRYWLKGWLTGMGISARWIESGIVKEADGRGRLETEVDYQEIHANEFTVEEGQP